MGSEMKRIPYPMTVSANDNERVLINDYYCKLSNHRMLEVKKGFKYDGASIPRIFWSLIGSPFTGAYQRAAFIHDVLYAGEICTRKECDEIFILIMKEHGCNWVTRNVIWSAVRICGGLVWNSHTKEKIEYNRQFIYLRKV